MIAQTLVEIPTSKEGEKVHINICPQTRFNVQPPRLPDPLDFCLWGLWNTLVYTVPIENKGTLHEYNFYACQIIRNGAGAFQKLWQSTIRRVSFCTDTGREHFYHLL